MAEEFEPKPIEKYFPINQVNEIADVESTGFGRRHYRPIYTIHKWWARRLGSVFRTILLYSLADQNMRINQDGQKKLIESKWGKNPETLWDFYIQDVDLNDKVILDPMMGGGTTVVEALRMGCNVIGGEINPVAWFVVKKEIDPIDPKELDDAFKEIDSKIGKEIRKTYITKCPECGKDAEAMYYFWVKQLPCLNCGRLVPLFSNYRIAASRIGSGYHVICPSCGEMFVVDDYRSETTCPQCSHSFTPTEGTVGRKSGGRSYVCPFCGQRNMVTEAIERCGKPEMKMYAIEYHCQNCDSSKNPKLYNGKGYKVPDDEDLSIFEKVREEFKRIGSNIPLPKQEIPEGLETNAARRHGYNSFVDMFNERQLLNLGKILRAILSLKNENVKEFMLLAFSNCLKYNNMYCKYDSSHNLITDIFRVHSFAYPSDRPIECNCFDLPRGRGSFSSFVNLVKEGKEYCVHPFDRYFENGKKRKATFNTPIEGKITDKFEELGQEKNTILLCGTSEYLPIPDKKVDAVITDPPYYSNVQYAELSDFFYVWLRLALKDKYPHFRSELTPKSAEVIENYAQNKNDKEFLEGLTGVFSEAGNKLKDEGIMVFTFHHKEARAWASVLQSIVDSEFYVTAIYPIRSEMSASTHIYDQANIEYDTIVACRKRLSEPPKKSWSSLEDRIYFRTKEVIEDLEKDRPTLSKGDIFVIALGKCLELYSKYYPNVVKNGNKVTVEQAVESIREIVDAQILGGRFDELTNKLDIISATYLTFVAGKGDSISYNTLNKELRQRNINIDDLLKADLVSKEGSNIKVLDLDERASRIRRKREDDITAIDRAHYLIYLMKEDRLAKEVRDWASEKAIKTLEVLAGVENNKEYKKLADFVKSKIPQTRLDRGE